MILELDHLTCGYGRHVITRDISFTVRSGEACFLLGPNGSGKTTLFRTILGLIPRLDGGIRLDGTDTGGMSHRALAQKLAYVPQAHTPPFAFTVRDVVRTARTAYVGLFATPGREDARMVERALDIMAIGDMGDARYTEISGGERQLVLIARAIAQGSRFLMMDEPTSNLDFGNQAYLLSRIRDLASEGYGIIMTTHAPDQAFSSATSTVLIHRGRIIARGTPEEALRPETLREAYGIPIHILRDGERRFCAPDLPAPDTSRRMEA